MSVPLRTVTKRRGWKVAFLTQYRVCISRSEIVLTFHKGTYGNPTTFGGKLDLSISYDN